MEPWLVSEILDQAVTSGGRTPEGRLNWLSERVKASSLLPSSALV